MLHKDKKVQVNYHPEEDIIQYRPNRKSVSLRATIITSNSEKYKEFVFDTHLTIRVTVFQMWLCPIIYHIKYIKIKFYIHNLRGSV
jgi:hypothetical protein